MTNRMAVGRVCEYLVQVLIEAKTGYTVRNLNDIKTNHPVTDLEVVDNENCVVFEVSVKAKITLPNASAKSQWPSVRGIQKKNQFIIFVDVLCDSDPVFYILSHRQWNTVLGKVIERCPGANIVDGAIAWAKRRGAYIVSSDILKYKNKWSVLPGVRR